MAAIKPTVDQNTLLPGSPPDTEAAGADAMDNRHGLQAFLFLIFGIYFVWLWSKGQTLAMKTWNIRLVDVQGRPVSQARALLRYLLSWIWLLPSLSLVWLLGLPAAGLVALVLGWVAIYATLSRFHPQRQFWHDALAGTRLISSPAKNPQTA
ncbi:MAG: RDD family protein [Betaproteobacteria bacterium]|nr:RDD family protein [Betaproteobacteria bacterium]